MLFTSRNFALAAPLTGLLMTMSVTAAPNTKGIDLSSFSFNKRQDDLSVIAPDDDPGNIEIDKTNALRSAVDARKFYTGQPTAIWYQADPASSDAAASFTPFQTTFPGTKSIPVPDNIDQFRGPNPWNVDHIFELQVIVQAFNRTKPSNIPDADWNSASSAVNTQGDPNAAIATAVTNPKNLQGIPNELYQFKKHVFMQQLTGGDNPREAIETAYPNYFGPVIQKYLEGAKAGLMSDTVDKIGSQIQGAANNNANVKAYFTSYGSSRYQGCIDMLSTWSGRPRSSTHSGHVIATSTPPVVPVPLETAPVYHPCPQYPEGGWADYGECMETCEPANYQCVQVLASNPATWKCSC